MSTIAELLGDAYKKGMTIDEINTAIADLDFIDKNALPESVPKSQFDAKLTELGKVKRELAALKSQSKTDDQKLKDALEDAERAKSDYLKKTVRLSVEKVFVGAGLSEKDYKGFIDGIVTEDEDRSIALANKVVDMVTAQKTAVETAVRKELRGKLPDPPAGGDGTVSKEDFDKMSLTEKMKFKAENPEQYNQIYGGN